MIDYVFLGIWCYVDLVVFYCCVLVLFGLVLLCDIGVEVVFGMFECWCFFFYFVGDDELVIV